MELMAKYLFISQKVEKGNYAMTGESVFGLLLNLVWNKLFYLEKKIKI